MGGMGVGWCVRCRRAEERASQPKRVERECEGGGRPGPASFNYFFVFRASRAAMGLRVSSQPHVPWLDTHSGLRPAATRRTPRRALAGFPLFPVPRIVFSFSCARSLSLSPLKQDLRTLLTGSAAAAAAAPPPAVLERYVDAGEGCGGGGAAAPSSSATRQSISPTLSANSALATDTVYAAYAELAARKGRALGREVGVGLAASGAASRGGLPACPRRPSRGGGGGRPVLPPPPLFNSTQEGAGGDGVGLTLGGPLCLDDDDDDDDDDNDDDDDGERGAHPSASTATPADPARRDGGDEDGRRFLRLLASAAGPGRTLRKSQALQVMALVRAHALHRDPSLSLDAASFLGAQFRVHPPSVFCPASGGDPARILAARTGPSAGASAPWTLVDGGLMVHPWDQLDDGGGVLGALAGGGGGGGGGGGLGGRALATPASVAAAASAAGPTLLSPFASLAALAAAARTVATAPPPPRARGGASAANLGEVALFSAVVTHLEVDGAARLAAHAALAGEPRAPAGRRSALLRHAIAWRVAFDGALGGGWGTGGLPAAAAAAAAPAAPGDPPPGGGGSAHAASQGTRSLSGSSLAALVAALVETVAGAAGWAGVEEEVVEAAGGDAPPAGPPLSPADAAAAAACDRCAAADPAARLLRLLLALTGAAEAAGDFAPSSSPSGPAAASAVLTAPARCAPGGGNERAALGAVLAAACLGRGGPVWALADAVERAGGSDPGAGLRAVLAAVGPAAAARLAGGAVAGRCGRGKGAPPGLAAPLARAAAAHESPGAVSNPADFTPPPSVSLAALALELGGGGGGGERVGAAEALLAGGGHPDHLAALVSALATAGVALAGGDPPALASLDDAVDGAIAGLLSAKGSRLVLAHGSRAALAAARCLAAGRGEW